MKELKKKLFWIWLKKILISISVVIVRYPLSPFVVLFFSSKDKTTITRFKWLMTIDNDLTGDSGWKEEHLWGDNPLSFWNRVRWLWRNGGNSFNYNQLGLPALGAIVIEEVAYDDKGRVVERYVLREDGFLFRKFYRRKTKEEKYWEVFIGWALEGPQHGRCKIVLTIRGRTKVN